LKLAAIDIGSNSIKLVVVDAAAGDSFAVLAREKEFVRLGHETLRRRHISRTAIDRAIECLKKLRSIAEARGAESIIATATASVREAKNSRQFVSEVEEKVGIKVEVLSGIEEARLIGLAASQSCSNDSITNLNIDIGGGSTEISVFRKGLPLALYSVDVGAIGLSEKFLRSDPPKSKELGELRHEIRAAFERPARELRDLSWQEASGTSGTILAIGAALKARLESNSQRRNQPAQPSAIDISLAPLIRLNVLLASLTVFERKRLAGISAQRSEIIIAGGQILEGAMRALSLNSLVTCEWALREGVIIDRLRELEAESVPPVADFADPKLRSVHALGHRFGYEKSHAQHVARLAETIFDSLAPIYELTRHQRTLLSAAALLHDIGYHIAHESHHKHTLYLIQNSELTGFSEGERAVIANIARYHRGSLPKERHPDFAALNPADRDSVVHLSAILRLADALDRSHEARVSSVECSVNDGVLTLTLHTDTNCDKEVFEAHRKTELFEDAFNLRVETNVQRSRMKARVI
jgi:exopolyphosphatase/guanosine-5'-triphosphate,3'-diphosphate pyrophosphatase